MACSRAAFIGNKLTVKSFKQEFNYLREFEICAVTRTLSQARALVHEELGYNENGCHYCKFP
jgi:hypothetical protein